MIIPALKDEAFLASVAEAGARAASDHLDVWWLGQSGFLVGYNGGFLLFDPYLSDSLTKKYAHTDKPHVRMTERVVDPARLTFVDVATASHNHTDHLDAETLLPLFGAAPHARLVLPAENTAFATERLGALHAGRLVPLKQGEMVRLGEFIFEAVPAAHEELLPQYAGFVVRAGRFTLYHSGDTVRFVGMAERLKQRGIDVAFLPINGRRPERRVAGNLDGPEAAQLAHDIGARCVVPCHYEMFEFNTATTDAFVTECRRLGQTQRVLQAGERWTVTLP